jgi:mRNA-degrading endonuclease RelE of RelBE toxin-antitoxin system
MDTIAKFLKKLSQKDRSAVQEIVKRLHSKDASGLDIKRLKGDGNVFRVRKGNIRIIYTLENSNIILVHIEFRGEDTYKRL